MGFIKILLFDRRKVQVKRRNPKIESVVYLQIYRKSALELGLRTGESFNKWSPASESTSCSAAI